MSRNSSSITVRVHKARIATGELIDVSESVRTTEVEAARLTAEKLRSARRLDNKLIEQVINAEIDLVRHRQRTGERIYGAAALSWIAGRAGCTPDDVKRILKDE